MSLDSVLKRARKRQAVQFTDVAAVLRPVGEIYYDPASGQSVQPTVTLHASLECKVKTQSQVGFDVQAGQTAVRLNSREVEFPIGTDLAEDDVIVILASKYSPADIGQRYRVTDLDRRTWQACRRAAVEESTAPILWPDPDDPEDGS